MTRTYDYRHVVTFQDTNLVGNVYFANFVTWQGACREHFLRDRAPGVLQQLGAGLSLVTVSCQCEFLAEVFAFDEVIVKMSPVEVLHNRLDLRFDYMRVAASGEELVAIGRHRVACMRHEAGQLVAAAIPDELRAAVLEYR
ncbi:MAG TPA: acyl-CoA thioesterase [Kofleriaceae bacterium]|jgi:enediyne biosynthesis thioesterase|nr:acyl-CoA thioesterase [Kofleriaceae bacterium]